MQLNDEQLSNTGHPKTDEERDGKPSDKSEQNEGSSSMVKIDGKEVSLDDFIANKIKELKESNHFEQKIGRLCVKNLCYEVTLPNVTRISTIRSVIQNLFTLSKVRHKKDKHVKTVLKNVSFTMQPREMVLLIGAPGSGKSSLLDILSQRRNPTGAQEISGDIYLNGKKPDKRTYQQEVSYVIQGDTHIPLLTVEQTFKFAASLQLPDGYSEDLINERVEIVLQLLHLTNARNTIVGNELIRGVSGGELRRVTVGVDWLKRPSFWLLDEPTSGLDSAAAFRIGKDLRTISQFGTPVLCSLLQPSFELFCEFDTVLIITKGQIAYWGPREYTLTYFENLGFSCPEEYSPAEFLATVVDRPKKFISKDQHSSNDHHTSNDRPQLKTSDDFIKAWEESDVKKRMERRFKGCSEDPKACEIPKSPKNAKSPKSPKANQATTPRSRKSMDNNECSPMESGSVMTEDGFEKDEIVARDSKWAQDENKKSTDDERQLRRKNGPTRKTNKGHQSNERNDSRSGPDNHHDSRSGSDDNDRGKQPSVEDQPMRKDMPGLLRFRSRNQSRDLEEGIPLQDDPTGKGRKKGRGKKNEVQADEDRKPRKFARSRFFQFRMLLWRGFLLLYAERFRFLIRELNEIAIAVILGTLFLQLGDSQIDSRNKNSLLFFSLAHLGFSSIATIPSLFLEKPVFTIQRKAKYFAVSMFLVATLIRQIPFAIVETLLFGTIVYWLVGLRANGARFFYFLLILFFVYLIGVVFSFFCAYLAFTPIMASIIGTILLILLILFSGFLIPKAAIPDGWTWGYWTSYFQYGTNALQTNEFNGATLSCEDREYAPPLSYNDVDNRFQGNHICPVTTGREFINNRDGYYGLSNRWWLFGVLVGFYIVFALATYMILRILKIDPVRKPAINNVDKRVKKLEEDTEEKETEFEASLTFSNINYTVDNNKQLLNNVSGFAKPGMFLGLMGASGSGKTTLLDVLGQRKTGGRIEGEIKVNGKDIDPKYFHRYIGYVEQMDLLFPFHTVLEALEFSADFRLDEKVTKEQRNFLLQRVLDTLALRDIAGSMIGFPGQGLSKEQRKKVSIGTELMADPQILFLDEPTTGLDALGADQIMSAIQNIAKQGTSVICTVHQPSQRIFFRMTHLLLLRSGGRQVYFGPIGDKAEDLLGYFKDELGLESPEFKNPADFIVEAIEHFQMAEKKGKEKGEKGQQGSDSGAQPAKKDKAAMKQDKEKQKIDAKEAKEKKKHESKEAKIKKKEDEKKQNDWKIEFVTSSKIAERERQEQEKKRKEEEKEKKREENRIKKEQQSLRKQDETMSPLLSPREDHDQSPKDKPAYKERNGRTEKKKKTGEGKKKSKSKDTPDEDPAEVWNDSEAKSEMEEELKSDEVAQDKIRSYTQPYPIGWFKQFWLLLVRFMYAYRRNPQQNLLTIIRNIIVGVVIATAFWNMTYDQSGAGLRPGAIFFIALSSNFSAFVGIISIFLLRPLYYRERFQGTYHSTAFSLAKYISDIPGLAAESFLILIIPYFIINLRETAGKFFFFYFVLFGLYLATSAFAQLFAIFFENIENAGLLFSTFVVSLSASSGFLLPRNKIHPWWIWLYWSSYQQYGLQALIVDQLDDTSFQCPNNEGAVAVPVNGGTEYYCPITSGDDILDQFDVPGLKWGAAFIVYGFYAIFVVLCMLGLKFINHQKR